MQNEKSKKGEAKGRGVSGRSSAAEAHEVIELPIDAEKTLRLLFRRERQLLSQLADVRNALESARSGFARANQLRANPRMELLRTRFAPPPRPQS